MPYSRRRFRPAPAGDFQPMMAINTTPLIDLMLVLLILFLITVPVQTHKVPVDLPGEGPAAAEPRPVHVLALDAGGGLAWDGRPIADAELPARLAALRTDARGPELHLGADAETRYERFDETLAVIRRAGIERLGFVGNQRFANAI